ncbi:MAG: transketolase, partial [Pseudomonadota bacterium]|nr:transketolase [Pseudomonadota bacterium]
DAFIEHRIPSTAKWEFTPEGQHIELGIAEMNLMLLLGAAGLSHSLFGRRVLPVGTIYDPFVARGLDALNYACYQDARFMLVGTPSGVTLAPEGGAHQSIGSPGIGITQPGLSAFEPAFADELATIMEWSLDHMQRHGDDTPDPRSSLPDGKGGAVYLRLSTNPVEQPGKRANESWRQGAIDGAYWLREPGPNAELVIAYQGVIAPEAIRAAGALAEARRDIGVLAITSSDRLHAGWSAAQRLRSRGQGAHSVAERLLTNLPRSCRIVTVIDGHPHTLSWLGGVAGHAVLPLGVEQFGQTGTIGDLYRVNGIDAQSIVDRATVLTTGRPARNGLMRVA